MKSIYIAAAALLAITACTKETEQAPSPYNEITGFTFAYGTQSDSMNAIFSTDTLTLIWPGEAAWPIPDSIAPHITVSDGATISPASGTKVAFKTGTKYTVKSGTGVTRTYVVKVSVSANLPDFRQETAGNYRRGVFASFSLINTSGEPAQNKYILVADDGTEYPLITAGINGLYAQFITDTPEGTGIPIGSYSVKALNKYNIPVSSETKFFTITDAVPTVYPYMTHTDTLKIRRGATFSIPVRNASATTTISAVRIYYTDANNYAQFQALTVVGFSADYKQLNVQVPEDAALFISNPQQALNIRSNTGQGYSHACPPIQVIE